MAAAKQTEASMHYHSSDATAGQAETRPAGKPLWRRIGWLLILWSASVLALGVVAALFRLLMTAAGMRTH